MAVFLLLAQSKAPFLESRDPVSRYQMEQNLPGPSQSSASGTRVNLFYADVALWSVHNSGALIARKWGWAR